MPFPETRLTLIQRLARQGNADDWRQFHRDYWGSVCQFARSAGRLSAADAEDVASLAFQVLLEGRLLDRWTNLPTAKLRSLICAVVRNILANQQRVAINRQDLIKSHVAELQRYRELGNGDIASEAEDDLFYQAWADNLIHGVIEQLLDECQSSGKGDRFRVLYGRICEELSIREIARLLRISEAAVDNYFRSMRSRLTDLLSQTVLEHVQRYSAIEQADDEFKREWNRLGSHLARQGGLESAIRRIEQAFDQDQ